MNPVVLEAIRTHARECYPRESCGVVIVTRGKHRYFPCRNVAENDNDFQIDCEDYAAAEDAGTVVQIVHSHPNHSPLPSGADLVGCETSGLPWLIVNAPDGHYHEFAPSGYSAPLVGRQYSHGVLDCYSIIRDYYQRELGIELPEPQRDDEWWNKGQNLYIENFPKAGFVEVPFASLRKHDVILMQLNSPVPNHGAVYLGDEIILQHCTNRLSSRDVYGGYWQRCTSKVLRYKDLLDA